MPLYSQLLLVTSAYLMLYCVDKSLEYILGIRWKIIWCTSKFPDRCADICIDNSIYNVACSCFQLNIFLLKIVSIEIINVFDLKCKLTIDNKSRNVRSLHSVECCRTNFGPTPSHSLVNIFNNFLCYFLSVTCISTLMLAKLWSIWSPVGKFLE